MKLLRTIKDVGVAAALVITLGFSSFAWAGQCPLGDPETTAAEAVAILHQQNPKDTQYVVEGAQFINLVAAAGLAHGAAPSAIATVVTAGDNAVISDGPGEPGGAAIIIRKGNCLVFHSSFLLTSEEFAKALDEVPTEPTTAAKPTSAPAIPLAGARPA